MDFAQVKKQLSKINLFIHNLIDCKDLLAWKNPILTGTVLALINISVLIFNRLNMSIIGFAVWKILFYSIAIEVKRKISPSDKE